ncbi:MFS transporter [Aeromicrobium sp. CTD01-1L150]|uniref:MFS transporter n=1 Tax=Aeromicrobium sp. CTD01-1L150 TaxID=3341830 RepID=UPI0035C26AF7
MALLNGTAGRAKVAVATVFMANGFLFASWMSRIPAIRDLLDLSPGGLGLLLLALSVGSLCGLPTAGWFVQRWGERRVVQAGALLMTTGVVSAGLAAQAGVVPWAAASLAVMGFGVGVWDVAMNLEGARVERLIGRTIMPRFHAGFSLGTVIGAAGGALAAALAVTVVLHLLVAAIIALVVALAGGRAFLGSSHEPRPEVQADASPASAWLEPRTLLIGLMVLALALTEGTANDWLAVALVDGYDLPDWAGAAGFAVFVSSMTLGRILGPMLLDRHGRVPVLWATMALAGTGVLLTVLGGSLWLGLVGALVWGLGASLGFPVGMSAAADDPRRAAARVSVVSTIGYTAFLAGPPLIGFVAERVGTLDALLVVAVLLVPSALAVPATRQKRGG